MPAGKNLKITIWRLSNEDDNAVGGAEVTGTVLYSNIPARMQATEPEQILLQQGFNTVRTFDMTVVPGTLNIKERDEVEITAPYNHPYRNDRFRIVGMRYSDLNPTDRRNYIILSLIRSVQAHAIQ